MVSFLCSYTSSDFYDLWLDAKQMLYGLVDCWVDNIRMTYDSQSRSTRNSPGVVTRVPGWPTTDTMEWIDSTYIIQNHDFGAYYTYIVTALANKGYERGKHIFGAPYDFRKGPSKFKSKKKKKHISSPGMTFFYRINISISQMKTKNGFNNWMHWFAMCSR